MPAGSPACSTWSVVSDGARPVPVINARRGQRRGRRGSGSWKPNPCLKLGAASCLSEWAVTKVASKSRVIVAGLAPGAHVASDALAVCGHLHAWRGLGGFHL